MKRLDAFEMLEQCFQKCQHINFLFTCLTFSLDVSSHDFMVSQKLPVDNVIDDEVFVFLILLYFS